MEKALTKVGSIKLGGFWITKKAKEELKDITQDLSAVSNTVEEKAKWIFNKLKGNPQKPLQDLLREYSLPAGLFPENVTCYEFDVTKARLIVYLPHPCETTFNDSSALRYATRVKAILLRGKLMGIEGIKTKTVLVWAKVTNIAVEGGGGGPGAAGYTKSDKICFTAGVKVSRPKHAYSVPCNAVRVCGFRTNRSSCCYPVNDDIYMGNLCEPIMLES